MNKLGIGSLWILVALCVSLATSCTSKTPPAQQTTVPSQPASQPAAQPATPSSQPAPAAAAPANVIASGQYTADPEVRCDLLEVKRVSGGGVLVKWRLVNTAAVTKSYDGRWADLYYIDPAENKKYAYLMDAEGNYILEVYFGNLNAGQQRGNWAKFPAPPPTSSKIAIHIPSFPPFEDVSVSQ
ncbi:MAG TPA: hypothetical protein VN176_14425 [Verrucomicrobiae bacterium]|jgi:hypothetical protein|nr:hypothetical protein [Verrucomicrobiae bacterium]